MVTCSNCHVKAVCAGHLSHMRKRCREVGIISVKLCLVRSVGIHLEQRLYPHLGSIVVVPSGIYHAAVRSHRGKRGVNLVISETDYI